MLRKAPLMFMVLALVLAILAAWSAHRWIEGRATQAAATKVATSPILVAGADLSAGQRLEAQHLVIQQWPAGTLPANHLSRPEQALGRVVKGALVKGEVILAAKLLPEGLAGGLSAVVPEGYRAMTVHVDEVIGVGGFLQPGDRVDVLVTFAKGPFSNDPATRVLLQDVPVLTVGEKAQEEPEGSKMKRQKATVVALQLRPEQGERLALAANEGKVILALRNQGDRQDQGSGGIRLTSLLPAAAAPPAPPAPPKQEAPTIEVIKGVERGVQSLGKPTQEVKSAKQASQAQAAPPELPNLRPAKP
ncbi:MAG: Flp pilus assembly protein CpaB [Desulfarculus sp.]|nr:Flp pilus assembly protein CpaB [Desulfarculus sp.]